MESQLRSRRTEAHRPGVRVATNQSPVWHSHPIAMTPGPRNNPNPSASPMEIDPSSLCLSQTKVSVVQTVAGLQIDLTGIVWVGPLT